LKFFTVLAAAAFPVADDALAVVVPALAGGVAAAVVCPLEHAVADAATRTRLPAANTAANTLDTRMSFSDEVSNRPWTCCRR
jgi:predicted phage-related endonuclease